MLCMASQKCADLDQWTFTYDVVIMSQLLKEVSPKVAIEGLKPRKRLSGPKLLCVLPNILAMHLPKLEFEYTAEQFVSMYPNGEYSAVSFFCYFLCCIDI